MPEEGNEGANPWDVLKTLSRETLDLMKLRPPRLLALIDLLELGAREVGSERREADHWRYMYAARAVETDAIANRDQRTIELATERDKLKKELEELTSQLDQKEQRLKEVVLCSADHRGEGGTGREYTVTGRREEESS